MSEQLTFKLEEFEGPLDLLLHLVSKNKMDLHDIPIFELIRQYTDIISAMNRSNIEVASEFIAMAARLVQLKSYLLLPHSEEGERMKQELTGELIEYDLCKRIAAQLGERASGVFHSVRKPIKLAETGEYAVLHKPSVLAEALLSIRIKKTESIVDTSEKFKPLVTAPFVTVASRVVFVLKGIVAGRVKSFASLFARKEEKGKTVATFLAVLELIRAGRISIEGDTINLIRNKLIVNEDKDGDITQ